MPFGPRGVSSREKQTTGGSTRLAAPRTTNPAIARGFSSLIGKQPFPMSSLRFAGKRGTCFVRSFIASSFFAISIVLSLASGAALAADAGSASASVEELHDVLTEAMKQAEALGYKGRFDLIAPAANAHIDQHFMASKSIGREWKKLSEEEQALWLSSFSNLTVANYAGRFKGYSGEHFVLNGEQDAPHDTKLVSTTLIIPDDDDVKLNYRLHKKDDSWKIIDVYMNGTVSELSLRRSEYSSTLKREGFESLIAAIKKKLEDFAAGNIDDDGSHIATGPAKTP